MGKIALGFFLVLVSPAAIAQMQKCVDERGRTHYTDKPIPGCKPAGQVAPPPAAKAPASPAPKKRAAKTPLTEQEKVQLASRCKTLKEEHEWLMSPRGRAVEAHAARVGQVKQAMRACP